MSPAIALRPARPTDSEDAVPFIYSSGPAAFDYVFSHISHIANTEAARCGSPLEFLHRAFVDGRGEFGYRTHYVVLADDRIVGAGAGYSGANTLAFTLAAARQIIGQYGLRAGGGVIRRGLAVERVVPPPVGKRLFYIGHLGIAAGLRGHGIGRQLIDHLLQHGRAAGCERVALDVSCANPRAQALYEKIGFRVTAEHRSKLHNRFARVPDHRRMEMAL
jgi:ribosomal protein S18 acetylase RimI-like enzyme